MSAANPDALTCGGTLMSGRRVPKVGLRADIAKGAPKGTSQGHFLVPDRWPPLLRLRISSLRHSLPEPYA